MSVKKMKQHNSQKFIEDLKRVSDCLVIVEVSNIYLIVMKKQLRKEAENRQIYYYLSDKVFKSGREVMIVI